ncbi:hypothetical protein OIU45_15130, partial [Lacticaseibacillus paracasei]
MRAIPRFLAPSILKSSQRGKFAPEPLKQIKAYGCLKRRGDKTLPQRINFLHQHQERLISQQQSLKKIIERINEKINRTKEKKFK